MRGLKALWWAWLHLLPVLPLLQVSVSRRRQPAGSQPSKWCARRQGVYRDGLPRSAGGQTMGHVIGAAAKICAMGKKSCIWGTHFFSPATKITEDICDAPKITFSETSFHPGSWCRMDGCVAHRVCCSCCSCYGSDWLLRKRLALSNVVHIYISCLVSCVLLQKQLLALVCYGRKMSVYQTSASVQMFSSIGRSQPTHNYCYETIDAHSGCGHATSIANDLRSLQIVIPGSATRSSFWIRKRAAMGVPISYSLEAHQHISTTFLGKQGLLQSTTAKPGMGDTATILACKRDRNKPCHPRACPNLFVLRAETAALLINSCEKSNDMQMLSRSDFSTKHRKYCQYNRHCLHVLGYRSPSEAATLRGNAYDICAHTWSYWWTSGEPPRLRQCIQPIGDTPSFRHSQALLGKWQFLIRSVTHLRNTG